MFDVDRRPITGLSLKDIEDMDEPINEDYLDITEEALKKLDPGTRESLIRERVRAAIRQYGAEGLSVDELVELTGHDKRTVQIHLNTLENLREIYSQKRNKKLTLYFANGKPLHDIGKKTVSMGNTYFDIKLTQGTDKKLLFHVTEKRFTLLQGDKTEGIIIIPLEGLDDFIEGLRELRDLKCEVQLNEPSKT